MTATIFANIVTRIIYKMSSVPHFETASSEVSDELLQQIVQYHVNAHINLTSDLKWNFLHITNLNFAFNYEKLDDLCKSPIYKFLNLHALSSSKFVGQRYIGLFPIDMGTCQHSGPCKNLKELSRTMRNKMATTIWNSQGHAMARGAYLHHVGIQIDYTVGDDPKLHSVAYQIACADQHVDKCSKCGQMGKLRKCSRCQNQYYCSRSCQISDWPVHKPFCTAAANFPKRA